MVVRKTIPIPGREQLQAALDYDPGTGIFVWKTRSDVTYRWNGAWPGKQAGSVSDGGYIIIRFKDRYYRAHRLAWMIQYNEQPPSVIDHINGVRTDNRIVNLRAVTDSANVWNSARRTSNTSGFKGVTRRKGGKWQARFQCGDRYYDLGVFDTPQSAYAAYCEVVKQHHGEFARTE